MLSKIVKSRWKKVPSFTPHIFECQCRIFSCIAFSIALIPILKPLRNCLGNDLKLLGIHRIVKKKGRSDAFQRFFFSTKLNTTIFKMWSIQCSFRFYERCYGVGQFFTLWKMLPPLNEQCKLDKPTIYSFVIWQLLSWVSLGIFACLQIHCFSDVVSKKHFIHRVRFRK